jgi:hypothetical protein
VLEGCQAPMRGARRLVGRRAARLDPAPPVFPRVPTLLDLLRRILAALAAPCACRSLGRPNLFELRKPRPYSLFDESASLPRRYEMAHFFEKGVFEDHVHALR